SLAGLHASPEVVADDSQLGDLDGLALVGRVYPGGAPAGARVLDIGGPVPLEPTDIEPVVEQPRAAIDLPTDGGVSPRPATGSGDDLGIEHFGQGARRHACRERREDPADDRRFGFVDAAPAAAAPWVVVLDHVVAVGQPTGEPALQH